MNTSSKPTQWLQKHKNALHFLLIQLISGMIIGVILSHWISSSEIEQLSSLVLSTAVNTADPQSFFLEQFVMNMGLILIMLILGFSLIGIPLIGFLVFTKGVQIGFSCLLTIVTYKLKGVLAILLTLIPQIVFDLAALMIAAVIASEFSYALLCHCASRTPKNFSLVQFINQRTGSLIVSCLLVMLSACIKSTLVLKLMQIFTMTA